MYEDEVMDVNAAESVYQDETLVCKECGKEFVFTAGEQRFYAEKGFQNKPKTCRACRDARKNGAEKAEKPRYEAVCAQCGAVAWLKFQPQTDRPVYCDACYNAMRAAHR